MAAIGWANPLRYLTGDAAYLAALLGTISGPIVLVGHSYGGAVIAPNHPAEAAGISPGAVDEHDHRGLSGHARHRSLVDG